MSKLAIAVVCRNADLTEALQESIDYYNWVEEHGAIQARHGATGPGRLWTDGERASIHAQLARAMGTAGPKAVTDDE